MVYQLSMKMLCNTNHYLGLTKSEEVRGYPDTTRDHNCSMYLNEHKKLYKNTPLLLGNTMTREILLEIYNKSN